jgi:hypothetical protein
MPPLKTPKLRLASRSYSAGWLAALLACATPRWRRASLHHVAIGWSGRRKLPARPRQLRSRPLRGLAISPSTTAVVAAITVVLMLGIRESARRDASFVHQAGHRLSACWFFSAANWVTSANPNGAFVPPDLGGGAVRLEPSCAAQRWCSLPILASMRFRPRRRRLSIRNATCRSAFSARWSSARRSTWRSLWCHRYRAL